MRFGVWHYLSGYVIIDIKGKNLERFLNRVVQSGGDIWHVRRTGSESVRACVSVPRSMHSGPSYVNAA